MVNESYEGLRINEVAAVKFAFSVYETEENKLDAIKLGHMMRALNMNPSQARLKELGQTEKAGEKFFTPEECMALLVTLKGETKEQGCYEDFIELLRLYDKSDYGKMLTGDLSHSLLWLGEKLSGVELEEIFQECLPIENEEGEIEYIPFLRKLCDVK